MMSLVTSNHLVVHVQTSHIIKFIQLTRLPSMFTFLEWSARTDANQKENWQLGYVTKFIENSSVLVLS